METLGRSWQYETFRRHWYSNRTKTTIVSLFHMGKSHHMPWILIVAPTNNAVDAIEELIMDVVKFPNADIRRLYCRTKVEDDIRNMCRENQLQRGRERRSQIDII